MPQTRSPLMTRWTALWRRLGAQGDAEAAFGALAARYAEPHRAYHTLDHVAACLDALEPDRDRAAAPDAVEFALWYHDAVYDPHATDSEARSADVASEAAADAGLQPDFAARVARWILATRHEVAPADPDAGLVADADLAILGAAPEVYAAYERQIRSEYAWVPDPIFRAGRSTVLRRFLDRPAVYATDGFRQRYEAQARRNVQEALARLQSSDDR